MITRKTTFEMGSRTSRAATVPTPAPRGFFEITSASLGADLQSLTRQSGADFVIIGMLVPTREGLALCDTLRKKGVSDSTVLMLRTVDGRPLPQPLQAPEDTEEEQPISAGEILIAPGRHEVTVHGTLVELTRTELRLLATMARRPGWVFSREKLIKEMHGEKYGCTARTIDVHITSLRRKLGTAAHHVETIRGVGYRFGN